MQPASDKVLATMAWDTDLNALRIENDKVMGIKCGLLLAEDQTTLQPGDVFYRLISATFIDEIASAGRHTVTVDVIDENGRRLDGTNVFHGWPWNRWPAYDERVQATVYGAQLAEWGIFAQYDANHVTYGPYWVMVDGVSDVFFGMGLPWNRHVSFTVVYQRMTWGSGTGGGTDPTLEAIKGDTDAILATLNRVFK